MDRARTGAVNDAQVKHTLNKTLVAIENIREGGSDFRSGLKQPNLLTRRKVYGTRGKNFKKKGSRVAITGNTWRICQIKIMRGGKLNHVERQNKKGGQKVRFKPVS